MNIGGQAVVIISALIALKIVDDMKCLNPTQAWIVGSQVAQDGIVSPKLSFSFREVEQYYVSKFGNSVGLSLIDKNALDLPCGKCIHCQMAKRKDMTTRLSNEISLYGDNCCFITLTYDDDNIPTTCFRPLKDSNKIVERGVSALPVQTLLPSDVQKFIKRLRRHLEYVPKSPRKRKGRDHVTTPIRYFAVGEYGGKTARPHYHLLIFGWRPSDMFYHSARKGNIVYRSKQIEKLWTFGFSTVQPCGAGVSRYCARYVTKKFVSDSKKFEPCQDSFFPEFFLQSVRNGGIGAPFFDRYCKEILLRGYVTYRQGDTVLKARIPTYYYRRGRAKCPREWINLRDARYDYIVTHPAKPISYDDLVSQARKYCYDEQRLIESDLL